MARVTRDGLQLAHEVGHLLGAVDVAREQDHVPHPELADEVLHVGRRGEPLEAHHDPLPDPADQPAQDQPPRRLRAASLTFFPSTGFPAAWSAAMAAFMTLPRSFGEAAPVSATARSTAAAMSDSDASWGR